VEVVEMALKLLDRFWGEKMRERGREADGIGG